MPKVKKIEKKEEKCPACNGSGWNEGNIDNCPVCDGTGVKK